MKLILRKTDKNKILGYEITDVEYLLSNGHHHEYLDYWRIDAIDDKEPMILILRKRIGEIEIEFKREFGSGIELIKYLKNKKYLYKVEIDLSNGDIDRLNACELFDIIDEYNKINDEKILYKESGFRDNKLGNYFIHEIEIEITKEISKKIDFILERDCCLTTPQTLKINNEFGFKLYKEAFKALNKK